MSHFKKTKRIILSPEPEECPDICKQTARPCPLEATCLTKREINKRNRTRNTEARKQAFNAKYTHLSGNAWGQFWRLILGNLDTRLHDTYYDKGEVAAINYALEHNIIQRRE
jgi:hypothetical protein